MLGTPTEETWPGLTSLPDYIPFNPQQGTPLGSLFTAASDATLRLLSSLLTLNPGSRITAEEALQHDYFVLEEPAPSPYFDLIPTARDASETTKMVDC